jgi:acetyl esterase/lipase
MLDRMPFHPASGRRHRCCRMCGGYWRNPPDLARSPGSAQPTGHRDTQIPAIPARSNGTRATADRVPPLNAFPGASSRSKYLHGSAWYTLDKDFATRPLFRHLAAQGHVIVDVAYRLFPETDVPGMVGDAKHAVAWVREHATELAIDEDRIVLAGGSAGGAPGPAGRLRPRRACADPAGTGRV